MASPLQRSRFSVSALFLLHGLTVASWVSRIPAAQANLHLSAGLLGLLLLAVSVGSMIAMPLTGWLISRHGSRILATISSLLFCLALTLPGWANSPLTLAPALFVFGACAGSMDIAMNAQAVAVEQGYGRPVMSSFHACFSLGGMLGAAAGGAIAGQGIGIGGHLLGAGFLLCLFTVPFLRSLLPPSADVGHAEEPAAFRLSRALVGLGALAFCILVAEGAMADWTAVYLRTVLQTGPGQAALGYAVFSATMVIGRLSGDWLTSRLGRTRLVRLGAVIASTGLAGALLTGTVSATLTGLAAVGLGLSVIVPLIFRAAAHSGPNAGAGLAMVTTTGYLGFLTGPPLIGGLAELIGLRWALSLVVASIAMGAVFARLVEGTVPAVAAAPNSVEVAT